MSTDEIFPHILLRKTTFLIFSESTILQIFREKQTNKKQQQQQQQQTTTTTTKPFANKNCIVGVGACVLIVHLLAALSSFDNPRKISINTVVPNH